MDAHHTLADLHELEARPENSDKIFELIDGQFVEKVSDFEASATAVQIGTALVEWTFQHPVACVTGAGGGYIMDAGDTVFVPEAALVFSARIPQKPEYECPVPPDIALEVKALDERKRDLRQKAEKYLAYGTRTVWLVFPKEKLVEVYVPNQDVQTFGYDDTLDGGNVLPGFTLAVKDMFPKW